LQLPETAVDHARERACLCGGRTHEFAGCAYRTLDPWSRARRVVGKAEILGETDNPRLIVTGRPATTHAAALLRGATPLSPAPTPLFARNRKRRGRPSARLRVG